MKKLARPVPAVALLLVLACGTAQSAAPPTIFTPPAGWSTISGDTIMGGMQNIWQGPLPFTDAQAKIVGMWTGSNPMQMLTLMQGHAVASPAEISRLFPTRDVSHGAQVQYHVATQPHTFCGMPGTLVNVRFGSLMGITLAYDLAVTQAGSTSYMLSYFHMASDTDPAAQRALLSLCPTGGIRRQA